MAGRILISTDGGALLRRRNNLPDILFRGRLRTSRSFSLTKTVRTPGVPTYLTIEADNG